MNWEKYLKNVIVEADKQNKDVDSVAAYLSYAEPLFVKNVPIIVDTGHFASLVGYDHSYVCSMAYAQDYFYRSFNIVKKNGKKRRIDEPLPDLKCIQRWILDEILVKIEVSRFAKAFLKGQTLKHNARFHRAQKTVVTLDIKDFFPSIKFYDVYQIFLGIGYSQNVSAFLANLCCLEGRLPQGAPTSPYLSNLRLRELDNVLSEYCVRHKIRYTRYADDLTFSGNLNPKELIKKVSNEVYAVGFVLNAKKTRVANQNACQEVTGIVVNHHMQVSKTERKFIRQQVYYIKKFGLDSHLSHIAETKKNYLNHLIGKVNFALFVNAKDKEMRDCYDFLRNLHVEIFEDL